MQSRRRVVKHSKCFLLRLLESCTKWSTYGRFPLFSRILACSNVSLTVPFLFGLGALKMFGKLFVVWPYREFENLDWMAFYTEATHAELLDEAFHHVPPFHNF